MISVFMYHDIRNSKEYKKRYDLKSFINVDDFKNHLDYITSNYEVIKTVDIPDNITSDKKCAVLTFDDGLKDHYDIVDILLDYKITGTFLIPTSPIINGEMIHSHKIQFIIACENEEIIKNSIFKMLDENIEKCYSQYSRSLVKDNWWTKDMIFITNFLRYHRNGKSITDRLFSEIVTNNEKSFCDNFYLNENNIKEMVDCGMEIGGHGYKSDILNSVNMKSEIDKSIDFISKYNNGYDMIYSYPNGIFNEDSVDYLKSKGCKFAYTTQNAAVYNDDLLRIPRFDGPQKILI